MYLSLKITMVMMMMTMTMTTMMLIMHARRTGSTYGLLALCIIECHFVCSLVHARAAINYELRITLYPGAC